MDRLGEYFNKKRQEKQNEEKKVDWDTRKTIWLEAIDSFYKQVLEWLKPFEERGDLTVDYKPITLYEEYLGHYETNKMILNFYEEQIIFEPIATLIIAANGRIDMIGKNGKVKFLLVPQNSKGPSIVATISSPGLDKLNEVRPKDEDDSENTKLTWKLSTPPPNVKFLPLTEESFSDCFLELINEPEN